MAFVEKVIDGQVHYVDEDIEKYQAEKRRLAELDPPHIVEISEDELARIMENDRRRAANQVHQLYLNNTDWYVVRKNETGKDIPADVVTKRQEARDAIQQEVPPSE